jgi:hypothetical protein
MQLLTPLGYKNIEECEVGEQLVAYEVGTGNVITNELLGKQWFSPNMFSDEYTIPVQVVDEDDNLVFEQIPVLDENGEPTYEQISVIDEDGNETFENGNQLFEDGEPVMTEPELIKTKEEIFTETYGDLTFRKINNTWDLFDNQSVWANLRVVHASDLQIGDVIYNDQDEDIEITSIEEDVAEGWWRLTVSGDHSYIADDLTLHNASRYWVGGGSSANWNATANTNWGSASGGVNNASVPTSTDDVIFDGAGVNGNTDSTISAVITILSINITSVYTATMTHNATLTVAGNITLGANYTIAGAGSLTIAGNSTITSNGKTWPNAILLSTGGSIKTLVGDLTVNGLLTIGNGTTVNKTTTEKLTLAGGLNNSAGLSGTADVYLTGGTWTMNGGLNNNLYINGNITIAGNGVFGAAIFTHLSGTVVTTGSTINFGQNTTITSGTIVFNNIQFSAGGATKTLVGNLTMTGVLSTVNTTIINKTTTEQLNVGGGLTVGSPLNGTADIYLTGGTWSGASTITNNLYLNGNITISGTVNYSGTSLTYLSGTITTTGSTIFISGNTTITSAGNAFNNVTFANTGTKTLVGNMTVNGLLSITGITTLNRTTTETISLFGGFSISGASNITLSGTAKVIAKGGTFSSSGGAGAFMQNNLDIDGNVTFEPLNNNTFWYSTGAFNYISGTTSGIIGFRGGCTVSSLGMTITSVKLYQAVNIVNDLIMTGPLLNTAINSSINYVSTPANVYSNGVDMAGGALSGNISLYLGGGTYSGQGAMTIPNLYLNGNITINGSIRPHVTNFTYLSGNINTAGSTIGFSPSNIITSGPIVYNNLLFGGGAVSYQLVGDLNINGSLVASGNTGLYKTTTEKVTVAGGVNITGGLIGGTADLYITGGIVITPSGPFDNNSVYLNGNITLSGTVRKRGGSLIYLSGIINSSNAILTIESPTLMIGFNKCPLRAIQVTAGQTLTVDQLPCGTASQICTISSTSTANYAINFQDGFEKIGRFVALTNATISRPNQLLVINTPRFNTNRSTNTPNIRYYNQSPNGFSKGKSSINYTMTTPALGLVNDPNFIRQ